MPSGFEVSGTMDELMTDRGTTSGTQGEPPSWSKRKREAETACSLIRENAANTEALLALSKYANDPKWEVRKVVAEALAWIPDDLFRSLSAVLAGDSNALVSKTAKRSLERRSPASSLASSNPAIIQRALETIETKFGSDARNLSLKLAEKFVELHLRSAVHDIKNVLTHLNVDLEELKGDAASSAIKQRAQRFKNGRSYLQGLVRMMSDYSEDLALKLKPEHIRELCQESVKSAIDQLKSHGRETHGVECKVEVPHDLVFDVSRFHIAMVLTNLIKNGIEAHAVSPTSVKPGQVTITAGVRNQCLEITVHDTGKGVEPRDLKKLREFIPGGSSKKRAGSTEGFGSGYGLPICRRYVSAHGGQLTLSSGPENGMQVEIRIPQASNRTKST